ncbi:MAG: YceI family protein [Bacteroidota bacterium]
MHNAVPRPAKRGGAMALAFLLGLLMHDATSQELLAAATPHHFSAEENDCEDFIQIDGSTNVNHFHFVQEIQTIQTLSEKETHKPDSISLQIPAKDFEPSNPKMYEDFLEFIRAGQFPYIDIIIFFKSKEANLGEKTKIAPEVEVKLAGQKQVYQIPGEIYQCRDRNLHISGEISIDLKDFDLTPPTKFMGMVKVSNEVFINFGLTFKNKNKSF